MPIDSRVQQDHGRCARGHHRNHHDPPHEEHDNGVACAPVHMHRGTGWRRELPRRHRGRAHAGTGACKNPTPRKRDDERKPDEDNRALPPQKLLSNCLIRHVAVDENQVAAETRRFTDGTAQTARDRMGPLPFK